MHSVAKKTVIVILIVSISISLFLGCSFSKKGAAPQPVAGKSGVVHFDGASLRYAFGVPFLELTGSSYEMGLQYGVLLRNQIKDVYTNLSDLGNVILKNLPFYIRIFKNVIIFFAVLKAKRDLPDEYLNEIRGISKGSNVPLRNILFASFIPELYNFSCTSFVKITNGEVLHGRNLDYYFPLIGENPVVVRYKPEGEIPYTVVGCVGYPGVFTGMNDEGITISVNAAPLAKANNKRTAPVTFEIRTILSRAKTLQDVEDIVNGYQSIKGWMFIVGSLKDKSGDVYNLAGAHIKRTSMQNDCIAVTNTFADDEFAHKYMTLHDAGSASSVSRLKEINLSVANIDSPLTAINALSNDTFSKYGNVIGAGDITTNNEGTLQSVVMDPQTHTIYFSSADTYAGFSKYLSYEVSSGKVSIYRASHYPVNSVKFNIFKTWFRKAELYYLEGNFKLAKKMAKDVEEPDLFQLVGEEAVDEKLGILKKDNALLKKADFAIQQYSDYALPYLIKAKIYFAKKDFVNAVSLSKKAFYSSIKFPYQEAEVYEILTKSYYELDDMESARRDARICMQMIKSYAIGKKEQKILKELSTIIASNPHLLN